MEKMGIKSIETNVLWYRTTNAVFTGALMYAIAGGLLMLAQAIVYVNSYTPLGELNVLSEYLLDNSNLFTIVIIAGYALYMRNLTGFAKVLNGEDGKSARLTGIGAIVAIIAVVWEYITFHLPTDTAGRIFMTLTFVAAYGVMALAFWKLAQSADFPPPARRGAKILFCAQILLIVGVVIIEELRANLYILFGYISISAGWEISLGYILSIIACILVPAGWSSIRKANPDAGVTQSV
jgi:hypothetical protein